MIKLTREQRNELLRVAGAYMREHPGVECFEVADHVFTHMLNNEDRFELEDHEAITISDYAYGIATFLSPSNY